ncbi:glycoside hydrolase family 95-like protein [Bacteroidota bacterium]
MKNISFIILVLFPFYTCNVKPDKLEQDPHDLVFTELAASWDEAIPLGNGMLGNLVWQKNGKLRFSLDRADLWDLRPMANLNTAEWKYRWVYEQWEKDNYKDVQDRFDMPYNRLPAPSKIPAGALEFDISSLGEIDMIRLKIRDAVCEVKWKNGARLETYIHATEPIGWFRFENIGENENIAPALITPEYEKKGDSGQANSVTGQDLQRLEYKQGEVITNEDNTLYIQEGWGEFKYQIFIQWEKSGSGVVGCWSISSEFPDWGNTPDAKDVVNKHGSSGYDQMLVSHSKWWNKFWEKSGILIPDKILEKQWYLELYKLGAAARNGAPPISLQAVWTADNGKLPPWKGDFHHDLNTQLSYWPTYSGNHLDLEEGFIDWLWRYKDTFRKYTQTYYETPGLNVPGVTTLTGEPMGGWIQYSFGPTVSAWLAHHFYLHWRYTMDREFLEEKAYPWIKEVAIFLDELSVTDSEGMKKPPISSSPEIFNNSREAWFDEITNYDLALIRWTFEKAAELADELGKKGESEKWRLILTGWPEYAIDPDDGMKFSSKVPYEESHRHFSHLMAFHPLGLIDVSKGDQDKEIIDNTIRQLQNVGSDYWTGYSFSWLGNLHARAFDGIAASEALRIFATSFCLPNSFHVNGDQSGKGYSTMTYRPFTLEGNFAFASAIQEMLIQSHTGIVQLFPAIPDDWKDISFHQLRTEGAFLVSAELENGDLKSLIVESEVGGPIRIRNSFKGGNFHCDKEVKISKNIMQLEMDPGEKIELIGMQ